MKTSRHVRFRVGNQKDDVRDCSNVDAVMENTSGQGKAAVLPAELKGWNWGAFFLHVIWGIGN